METIEKMPENIKTLPVAGNVGQCQFFVVRKKRLCRMTVRPGRDYCGEHEPKPTTDDGQVDTRVPCPYDGKHTCYASKLDKHLLVCNARKTESPPYIVENINAPTQATYEKILLGNVERSVIDRVIEKVGLLYDEHVQGNIEQFSPTHIHRAVLEELDLKSRTDSSKRHLFQASALLAAAEHTGLVNESTCYVELGAGKGQLSYYIGESWCHNNTSTVISIDRAALRHKRDNKLSDSVSRARVRADLKDLALHQLESVAEAKHVVGVAKHLCGVATDYALRCMTGDGIVMKSSGVVMATCCHHRCEQHSCLAAPKLQELGITPEEFNVILGIVSWATCGDGLSRDKRKQNETQDDNLSTKNIISEDNRNADKISTSEEQNDNSTGDIEKRNVDKMSTSDVSSIQNEKDKESINNQVNSESKMSKEQREQIGRKAKALIDWGRILYLRDKGFDAKLFYYVPVTVSLENFCIIAKKQL